MKAKTNKLLTKPTEFFSFKEEICKVRSDTEDMTSELKWITREFYEQLSKNILFTGC